MFDISFGELMIVGIIGLVVLGPERLPSAIRSVRTWMSKIKSFSHTVQTEIKEELRIHELHENLKQAEKMDMTNLSPELAESVESLKEAAAMVNKPFEIKKSLTGNNITDNTETNEDVSLVQPINEDNTITKSDKITND